MTRSYTFQTAAAKRKADPLTWTVNDHEPVTLVAMVDLATLGVAAAELGRPLPAGDAMVTPEGVSAIAARLDGMRGFLTQFIVPEDRERWERDIVPELDMPTLLVMMQQAMGEYTQMDPTLQASSSDGSPPTSTRSTDGAQPVVSTRLPSPPIG